MMRASVLLVMEIGLFMLLTMFMSRLSMYNQRLLNKDQRACLGDFLYVSSTGWMQLSRLSTCPLVRVGCSPHAGC